MINARRRGHKQAGAAASTPQRSHRVTPPPNDPDDFDLLADLGESLQPKPPAGIVQALALDPLDGLLDEPNQVHPKPMMDSENERDQVHQLPSLPASPRDNLTATSDRVSNKRNGATPSKPPSSVTHTPVHRPATARAESVSHTPPRQKQSEPLDDPFGFMQAETRIQRVRLNAPPRRHSTASTPSAVDGSTLPQTSPKHEFKNTPASEITINPESTSAFEFGSRFGSGPQSHAAHADSADKAGQDDNKELDFFTYEPTSKAQAKREQISAQVLAARNAKGSKANPARRARTARQTKENEGVGHVGPVSRFTSDILGAVPTSSALKREQPSRPAKAPIPPLKKTRRPAEEDDYDETMSTNSSLSSISSDQESDEEYSAARPARRGAAKRPAAATNGVPRNSKKRKLTR